MEEKKISFIQHELMMAKAERTGRRLWIATLIMIALLGGSNIAWIIHFFG